MDKTALKHKILTLEGLTNEEKSALLELLNKQKKYGLVWEEKPEDVEERLRDSLPVFKEVKERSILSDSPDAPNHILIEGDNLEALTALSYTHEGKIDVIYIDPPYNTGNKDFIYNDSFVDSEDGYRHSKWLSFMSKRLRIAKRLLKDDGVIFVSIDDNEFSQLRLLMDDIFGFMNFRNTILVRRRIKSLNSQFASNGLKSFNVGFEYILCFSKTSEFLMNALRMSKENASEKGRWDVFWSNADRPTMRYELLGFTPTTGQWRNSKDVALTAVENYKKYEREFSNKYSLEEYSELFNIKHFIRRIPNGVGKNGGVQHWVAPSTTTLRTSNWTDIEVSQIGKEFDFAFNNPKSKKLIIELLKVSRTVNPIILDFFAGSGTTLHATMQLNSEDGGHRQCILVTNNENKICEEVTYERNKRVINGYTTPKGEQVEGLKNNSLRYYKTELLPREKSPRNMRALMAAATELLCIKEDLYEESKRFGRYRTNPKTIRYFEKGNKRMLIIFCEELADQIAEEIKTLDFGGDKLKIYIFSPDRYAFDDNFYEVQDKVTLVALPAAIYDAYRRVLPKRIDKPLLEVIAEERLTSPVQQTIDFESNNDNAQ